MKQGILLYSLMLLTQLLFPQLLLSQESVASAVFEGDNANLWLLDEHSNVSSYSHGKWLDTFTDANYVLDQGQHALINNVINSSTPGSVSLAPVSLAGFKKAQLVLGEDSGLVALSVFPGGGEYKETIRVSMSVDAALLTKYKVITLSTTVEGEDKRVVQFAETSISENGRLTDSFYVYKQGDTAVESTLTGLKVGGEETLGQLNETYTLTIEHPDGERRDTDNDGLPDVVELAVGLDPLESNWQQDSNGDGWADFDQWLRSESGDTEEIPLDTDMDGWSDIDETWRGTNPEDKVTALATNGSAEPAPQMDTEQYRNRLQSFKDHPVAARLYSVEYILDLTREGAVDSHVWNGTVDSHNIFGDSLYDSDALLKDSQLVWANVESSDIPSRLKYNAFVSLRDAEQKIRFRTSASTMQIVDITADVELLIDGEIALQRHHYRHLYAGASDVTPISFTPFESWESAKEWKQLYIEHLKGNLVVSKNDTLTLEGGLYVDVLQSLIQQELSLQGVDGVVDFRVLSTDQQQSIRQFTDTLSLRENRSLADVAQDIVMLISAGDLLNLKTLISDKIESLVDQPGDMTHQIQQYLSTLVNERYLPRLMLFFEGLAQVQATPGLSQADADSDGDTLLNVDEINTPLESATYPWLQDSDNDSLADNVDTCPLTSQPAGDTVACDKLPQLTVSLGDAEEAEAGDSFLLVSFQLDSTAVEDVSFDYQLLALEGDLAKAGLDFGALQGSLVIRAGELVVTIVVPIYSDTLEEGEESFHLILSDVNNATSTQESTEIVLNDVGYDAKISSPINVIATGGDGEVSLTWDPVTTADGYRVYRGVGLHFKKEGALLIGDVSQPNSNITNLYNNRMYFYAVEAYKSSVSSALSDIAYAYPYRQGNSGLEVEQSLDFGDVLTSSTQSMTFTIKNPGDSVVSLENIILPDSFSVPDFNAGDVIGPASEKNYQLQFSPPADGGYSGRLIVKTASDVAQGWFDVRGYAKSVITYPRLVSHVTDGQNGIRVPDSAYDIAISPAGEQIVIADTQELQVYRRNPVTGDVQFDKSISIEKGYSRIARYNSTGDRLYLGSLDLLEYVRDVETGELSFNKDIGITSCDKMIVSISGEKILCASINGFSATLYTRSSSALNDEVWQANTVSAGAGDRIWGIEFSDEDSHVVLSKTSGLESYSVNSTTQELAFVDKIDTVNQLQSISHLGNNRFVVANGYDTLEVYELASDGTLSLQQTINKNENDVPNFTAFWMTAMSETNSFVVGPNMLRFTLDEQSNEYIYKDIVPGALQVSEPAVSKAVWHEPSQQLLVMRSDSIYATTFYTVNWKDGEAVVKGRIRGGEGGFEHVRYVASGKNGVQLLNGNQLALRNRTSSALKQYSVEVSTDKPITQGSWQQEKPPYTSQYVALAVDKNDYYQLHHEYLSQVHSIHHYRWSEALQQYLFIGEYSEALDNLEGIFSGGLVNASEIAMSPDGQFVVVSIGTWETARIFLRDEENGSLSYLGSISDSAFAIKGNNWGAASFSPDSKQMFMPAFGAVYAMDLNTTSGATPAYMISNNDNGVSIMNFPRQVVINDAGTLLVIPSTKGFVLFDRDSVSGNLALRQEIPSSDPMFQGVYFGSVSALHFVENDTRILFTVGQGVFWLKESADTGLWSVDRSIIPSSLGGDFQGDYYSFNGIVFSETFAEDTHLVIYGEKSETGVYVFEVAAP